MKDFESIYLGSQNGTSIKGKFKISEVGLGWKSMHGEIITVSQNDIKKLYFTRVGRDHELKILKKNGQIMSFDGFPKDAQENMNKLFQQYYSIALEEVHTSTRGYNWGSVDFDQSQLQFNVQEKVCFDLPLNQVSNTAVSGKNEVSVEFQLPRKDVKGDQLVEIRFYVPGSVTQGQIMDDGTSKFLKDKSDMVQGEGEMGEITNDDQQVVLDDQGDQLSQAQLFCDTIKLKSNMDQLTSELLVSFEELLCLVPRGRYKVDLHQDFFRLRGKSHDYKIFYHSITKMCMVPKPDDLHWNFVVGIHPPLRQGQTRYPFLVFQIEREEDMDVKVNLSEENKEKFGDRLQEEYDGALYTVLSDLFHGVSGKKVLGPSMEYLTTTGHKGLKCSQKANEAYLYPLDKAFLAVSKPPMYIPFVEIASVVFSRVSSTSSSTKTIEVKFGLTTGQEYSFSSIPREEHERLEMFCREKKLKVVNEVEEGVNTQTFNTMFGAADEESEEDEDFVAGSESDVNEEFNEDYDSEAGSDEEQPVVEEKPKKKRMTEDSDKPKKRQKKEKKEGPKRAMTSFLYFSQEYRPKVKAQNPSFGLGAKS
jgi:structure-specific recognition protein 1